MPREQFDKKIAAQPAKPKGSATDPELKGWFNVIKTDKLEKDKKVTDYTAWSYDQYKHSINIVFNDKRTAVIGIHCYSEDKYGRCPSIGNVRDGTSEQDALRKLGSPAEQRIDGVKKRLHSPRPWREAGAHAGASLPTRGIRPASQPVTGPLVAARAEGEE